MVWTVAFAPKKQPGPDNPQVQVDLPPYTMLFENDKLGGGRFGDALVPSLSRTTTLEERERVARGIAANERLTNLSIYSTNEAYQANVSASYSDAHPDAMKSGFLGSLDQNEFRPAKMTYP